MPFRYFHSGTHFCSVLRVSSVVLWQRQQHQPRLSRSRSQCQWKCLVIDESELILRARERARFRGLNDAMFEVLKWCAQCVPRVKRSWLCVLVVTVSMDFVFCVLCLECAFYFIVLFFYLYFFFSSAFAFLTLLTLYFLSMLLVSFYSKTFYSLDCSFCVGS